MEILFVVSWWFQGDTWILIQTWLHVLFSYKTELPESSFNLETSTISKVRYSSLMSCTEMPSHCTHSSWNPCSILPVLLKFKPLEITIIIACKVHNWRDHVWLWVSTWNNGTLPYDTENLTKTLINSEVISLIPMQHVEMLLLKQYCILWSLVALFKVIHSTMKPWYRNWEVIRGVFEWRLATARRPKPLWWSEYWKNRNWHQTKGELY